MRIKKNIWAVIYKTGENSCKFLRKWCFDTYQYLQEAAQNRRFSVRSF